MTTDVREAEQKYEADLGVALPSLDGLPGVAGISAPEVETLETQYYDTDDLRLLRAGITVRRREEEWRLRLPPRPDVRLPAPPAAGPPDELARLVRGYTRGAELRPVARVETRRRRTTLRDAAGASLARVTSDEVSAQTLGESTTLSRWNEIELELTGGRPRLLRAASKRLRDGGLRPAGGNPRLERTLATALAPAIRSSSRSARRQRSGEVVLAYLDAQATTLKALDPAVRRDEQDSVHQMRVTIRRLRGTLQSFPMIMPGLATRHLRDELKWLGGVLGDARDGEVLSEYLRARLAGTPPELVMGPAQARIRTHFAPREAAARRAVLEALDSPRYFGLLDELDRLLGDPPLAATAAEPAQQVLPGAVARAHRRTRRRMHRASRTQPGQQRDAALHETRKAAKRARYAAEAVRPVHGKKARRYAKRMKAVQSVLGDHQDAVNARAVARDIAVEAQLAGESSFSFGLLHERAHRDALEYQRQASRVWKRAKPPW
jgi:CHAD domain-containing protein